MRVKVRGFFKKFHARYENCGIPFSQSLSKNGKLEGFFLYLLLKYFLFNILLLIHVLGVNTKKGTANTLWAI